MSTLVRDCVTLVGTESAPASLAGAVDVVGRKGARVVAMELLNWLQRQHRFRHGKPLELRPDHTWCRDLPKVVDACPDLGALLQVRDGQCDFRLEVTEETRGCLRQAAVDEYRPVLKT